MHRRAHLSTLLVCLGAMLLFTHCATDVAREAAQGYTATVQTLLTSGADGDTRDRDGKTALMLAAARGHTDVMIALLAKGTDVNLQLPSFGRYHALVIGHNAYEYLPKLETAVPDAAAMAAILRDTYNFDVTLLLDATREQLFLALEKMHIALTEDDHLLIYYAGMAYWIRKPSGATG